MALSTWSHAPERMMQEQMNRVIEEEKRRLQREYDYRYYGVAPPPPPPIKTTQRVSNAGAPTEGYPKSSTNTKLDNKLLLLIN